MSSSQCLKNLQEVIAAMAYRTGSVTCRVDEFVVIDRSSDWHKAYRLSAVADGKILITSIKNANDKKEGKLAGCSF